MRQADNRHLRAVLGPSRKRLTGRGLVARVLHGRIRCVETLLLLTIVGCPRQDSNLRSRLRRAVLYPLSYEGREGRGYQRVLDKRLPANRPAGSLGG